MSHNTAGPKITIDGDLSCRPAMPHYRGSGRCKNPAVDSAGLILFLFFVSVPIFHKYLFIFVFIVCYRHTVKIYKPANIHIVIK